MRNWMNLFEDASTKAALEAQFGDESNYPSHYENEEEIAERKARREMTDYDEDEDEDDDDDDLGPHIITGHGPSAFCDNWSSFVKAALGDRAIRCGFDCRDNPGTDLERYCDGHAFALVDGRYIVDGWIKNVECLSNRAVFDLQDPADAHDIKRFYGDPANWSRYG